MKFGEVETSDQVLECLKSFGNQYIVEWLKVPYKGLAEWEVELAFKHILSNYIINQGYIVCFKLYELDENN